VIHCLADLCQGRPGRYLAVGSLGALMVATSFGEYQPIQDEGVVVEILIVDPVFRMSDV
jgi:hypothetical protein